MYINTNRQSSLLQDSFVFLFSFINYSATNIFANKYMGVYSDYFLGVYSEKQNQLFKKGLYKWSSCGFHLLNYFQDFGSARSWLFLFSLINPNATSLKVEEDDPFFLHGYRNSCALLLEPINMFQDPFVWFEDLFKASENYNQVISGNVASIYIPTSVIITIIGYYDFFRNFDKLTF